MHFAPFGTADLTVLVLTLMGLALLIALIPSCGEQTCLDAHSAHKVASLASSIEKTHNTWHGTDRPSPTCALCASRRRDEGVKKRDNEP